MKKILIGLIVCMFTISMLSGIAFEEEELEVRKFIETRDIIPVYTARGIEKIPNGKGKPGAYVVITSPDDGATVSGTIIITVDSNYNPTISIDGFAVGSGLSYEWNTVGYADGSHTIQAAARGHTDTVTVTVDNGGTNNPPTIIITNPNNGATVSDTVTITVDATDPEDGTLTADIYIDGSYVTSSNSYDWDTTSYTDGDYTIYAEATDTGGLSDSYSITVTVNNGVNPVEKYALVIGISDYRGIMNDLQYCDDDAIDWKNFLESKGYTVTILLDRNAKANKIEAEIDNLLALEDGNDYVAFTYSGHGSINYGSSIISHDMYYMSSGWFKSKFDTADSSHIYFTFDACEIGGMQTLVENNRVGAFASDQLYSYDGESWMRNGVYTYYQMEGWGIYDNFEEDGLYAKTNMENWASQYGISVDPFVKDMYSGPMTP